MTNNLAEKLIRLEETSLRAKRGNLGLKVIKYLFIFCFIVAANANANIETIHPKIGSIQKSFTEPAQTRLENIYEINMPLTGQLQRIIVKEGTHVTKDQVVAKLDADTWQQTLQQNQARLKTYQAMYKLQQKTVYRRKKLAAQDFIDKQALDQAVAERNAWLAQMLETKAAIATAKYNLQQTVLHSPITGTVLNRLSQGGKWITTGTPLLSFGDLDKLEVICDVLTQEAQQLKKGDKVSLTSVGSPITLNGKVKQIYPAGFTKQSSLGVDEQRINVIISLKDPNKAKLGVGYRLQAKFLIGSQQKNALIVPRFSVLQDKNENYYVFKVIKNRLKKQVVKVGTTTDNNIAIISGLTTSGNIVAQPTAEMRDGMKI